jgi:hypothetical protein
MSTVPNVPMVNGVDVSESGGAASAPVAKARKGRARGTGPSRPKPLKALLSLREHAHYARLKIALKQGARINAPVVLADFCKPLLPVDDKEGDEVLDESE